jgi:ATP-dependent 26S proteasome regulatory subunit
MIYKKEFILKTEINFVILIKQKAICTEAGLMALRERRMKVTNEDFKKSKENVLYRKNEGTPEGLYL